MDSADFQPMFCLTFKPFEVYIKHVQCLKPSVIESFKVKLSCKLGWFKGVCP